MGARIEGRGRYPCGQLKPVIDRGTPELLAKRARESADGNARLAGYPLGRLCADRIISQGDHFAGRRYFTLFTSAVRPLTVASGLRGVVASGMLPQALALM